MGLFSKLKDYNVELEDVLDSKYFSSNIKNLLLNMVYKIENSYSDYKEVKRCVRSKEDFLNEIVETIRLYCDNVKTVEPDSDQAKMLIKNNLKALTNERERSILTYPTEIALLFAISDISPKYFYMKEENPLKNVFQNILVDGYNASNMEILRDFNGWSWDITYDEKFNYTSNLIYINLLMILGEKFLYEWRTYGSTRRDFIQEAKKFIKIFTGNEKFIKLLYKYIYITASEKEKIHIETEVLEKNKLLKKMSNKIKFLEDSKNRKLKLTRKVEKIDFILHDEKALQKAFEKNNAKLEEKKKIKSIKKYKKLIELEREKYISEINEVSNLLKPSNFVAKKQELEEYVKFFDIKETEEEILIAFQKEFLHFIDKKLSKMKTRDEIIDIIYELRYYKGINVNEKQKITDIEELEIYIEKIMKKAITALCQLGAMKIISMDINLNFEIIMYALDTKIIELEQIKLYFEKENDKSLVIKVFDKDVFEKQGRKKIDLSKKTLEVKQKRKIKLFN